MSAKTKIQTPTESYVVNYPEPIMFADKQWSVFWLHNEVKVEKDLQDLLVNTTPAEKHGIVTTLKLFTKYELFAGEEYWTGRFKEMFPRPEFTRMGAVFASFELGVHAPFYNKINELLHLNTDEFYTDYVNDPALKDRMDFINAVVDDPDDLVSIGAFSMVEGAILYSNFAYLKHFQSQGKNKMTNIVRGINFSLRDENIHSIAGAWCFRKLLEERNLQEQEKTVLVNTLNRMATVLYEHECVIIDKVFEQGGSSGITAHQLKNFVQSRLNECLIQLGLPKLFEVKYNPIADWFYDGTTGYSFNDFFSGIGNQYHRDWDATEFIWEDE